MTWADIIYHHTSYKKIADNTNESFVERA